MTSLFDDLPATQSVSEPVSVDVTPSLKTLRLTGPMSLLRIIEEGTDTWAHWKGRVLEMPAVRQSLDQIIRVTGPDRLVYTDRGRQVVDSFAQIVQQAEETQARKTGKIVQVDDYTFAGTLDPWEHQLRAFGLGHGKPAFGYFMEQGTGKTFVVINEAAYLWEKGLIDLCLVIAWPSGVPSQWIYEALPAHMPARIPIKTWVRRPGRKIPPDIFEPFAGLKFYAVNLEQLQVASGVDLVKQILGSVPGKRVLLVFDESSRLKAPQSKRSREAWKLAEMANYRRIMTGTPITTGIQNLYSQFRLLDPNIIGVSSYTGFRNRYCRMGGWDDRQVIDYKNVEELMNLVHGYTFRVRARDCLDLPADHIIPVRVEFHPEQQRMYEQMRDDYFLDLGNGTILDGDTGGKRIMRLQQIVCGHVPEQRDGRTVGWAPVKNHRLETAQGVLDGCDGKSLIFCRYTADVQQMVEMLGDRCLEYSGKVGPDAKDYAKHTFKTTDLPYLVVQEQSGSHGLDMPYAQNILYFSRSFSYENWEQSQKRILRGGQKNICRYFVLQTPNSVDMMIEDVIRNQYDLATKCLDGEYVRRFL